MISVVPPVALHELLGEMLSGGCLPRADRPARALQAPRDEPFRLDLGGLTPIVDYEPGESTSGLFGGNSNWRGPIWFPLNYLTIQSLRNWDTGSARTTPSNTRPAREPGSAASTSSADLARRLVSTWLPDADGRRPVYGAIEKFQTDPEWHDLLQFHEYFHGDTGAGIGASHQTGWTGFVAHLICRGGVLDQIAQGRSLVAASCGGEGSGWTLRLSRGSSSR